MTGRTQIGRAMSQIVSSKTRTFVLAGWGGSLGVNFINVLRMIFSYKCRFSAYVLALSKNVYQKFVRLTLMKLTVGHTNTVEEYKYDSGTWCQFHQHFMSTFLYKSVLEASLSLQFGFSFFL